MFLYNGRYGVVTDNNGLYYMRARYYNVDIKRFINQDVVEGNITNSPSLNKYAYCQGNPVSMFDPFGLSPKIDRSAIGHGVLDLLGMVPVVGALADIANGLWYMSEGDYFSAASSFVSSVPGLGDIAGGIAKAITGCTKYAKAFKFATRLASNIGNFALGAYQTATQIYGLWDKYVTQGKPWGEESLGEFLGAAFTGISTVFSAKGVADDIANYKNTKHDILTSQCFVEGTLVVTKDGDKPIEEIQAGDLVYSTNPETGESEYKEVVRTFRKETDILIHIFVNDDEIETTPVHPFWVDGEWVAAKDLREGDELTLADGSTATITKTYGEQLDEPVIVYNFEVSDFHTYYVTDNGVLVHNATLQSCSVDQNNKTLLKGSEWNEYFSEKYGYDNVEWTSGVPKYGNNGKKTSGVLSTSVGDFEFISGINGPSSKFPNKTIPGRNAIIRTHVEAHAAATMRDLGIKEGVLYINRVPCGPATGFRNGCEYMLPRMLPEGATMQVIGPDGYNKTFIGLIDIFG